MVKPVSRVSVVVFLLSTALLGFEISLIRLLSYAQWYHFAYMVISVALLGFGASGTLLVVFRARVEKQWEFYFSLSVFACVLSLALSPKFFSSITLDPFLLFAQPTHIGRLVVFYVAGFLPFFFGACVLGLSFTMYPENAGRIYFFNMVGSGIGCLFPVMLLNWVSPNSLPAIMVLLGLPALVLAIPGLGRNKFVATISSAAIIVLANLSQTPAVKMSEFKGLSRALHLPDARVIYRKINPLGVLEVVQSSAIRYAPGLSFSYGGNIPSMLDVFLDGERVGTIINVHDSSYSSVLDHSITSLPYRIQPSSNVLIVGAGTGNDIHMAKHFRSRQITGIEMNPGLVELMEKELVDFTGNIVREGNVKIINAEARSFFSRHKEKFDLIVIPIMDGMTASAAGTQALHENYLFTVESFVEILDHLTPNGMFMVSTWMSYPPRASLKALATMIESLRKSSIDSVGAHLAAIRGWSVSTVLAKKRPWTTIQVDSVRAFCERLSFDLIYLPGIRSDESNRYNLLDRDYLYETTQMLLQGKSEGFAEYPFRVAPATDDKPYFGHFFKWKSLPYVQEIYGTGRFALFELSYFFLLITLMQLILVSFALIILPLVLAAGASPAVGELWKEMLYFGGIGLGYLFTEVVLIQKFILFLGHPVYSVTAIVATMLVCSGVGSYHSPRLSASWSRLVFWGIVALLSIYAVALSPILRNLLQLEFGWRLLLCVFLISPLAFLMGLPFPVGIARLSRKPSWSIPWAWGINGYFSTVSASLATLVSMELGFLALSIFALSAYTVAGISQKWL
jgi:spermidine synthase